LVPAITSLLIVGGAVALTVATARSDKRRRVKILRAVAERRRAELDTGGWFGNPLLSLRLHDGIRLRISMWSTKHGRYTEYAAALPPPGLPACKVVPVSLTGRVGKALGAQDIEIEDGTFNQAFIVKGDDPAVVRRLWSRPYAQDMALAFTTSRLECDERSIKLLQPIIESVGQVELGIDLVLDLARADPYGQHVLGELPEASIKHGDRFVEVELPGPSRVRVGPVERAGIVRTCVRTSAVGPLPDEAETQVTALGATLQQTEHELQIWWPSVETDMRRLTSAVDVLRRLAGAPSLGVFR
jgi:hypothetical protein